MYISFISGISKKLEVAAKKKDCGDIRPWIKSSVNHCYWVAASCGNDGDLKEQKWSSLTQHIANQHHLCQHGPLNDDRMWLREGKVKQKNILFSASMAKNKVRVGRCEKQFIYFLQNFPHQIQEQIEL
jgi:hypothetical protein